MVNKNVPKTYGDGMIHKSHFDVIIHDDTQELHVIKKSVLSEAEKAIGKLIAERLVDDGATLQMGIILLLEHISR